MMLIIFIASLLKNLNRYIRLPELLCPAKYILPYEFQTLEENLYDMAGFREYRLFPGWFQMMLVVSWLVSDSFWMI